MAINHDNSEKYWTVVMGMKIIFTESYEGVALPRTARKICIYYFINDPPSFSGSNFTKMVHKRTNSNRKINEFFKFKKCN